MLGMKLRRIEFTPFRATFSELTTSKKVRCYKSETGSCFTLNKCFRHASLYQFLIRIQIMYNMNYLLSSLGV